MPKKTKPAAAKTDDLASQLAEAQVTLAKLVVDKNAGKLKNTSALPKARREIARIKTIIRAGELIK